MAIKKVRKQKQKQKQKQVQNVQQKVVVRIGDVSKKKSRRRRTRKPKQSSSEGSSSMMQSLQPNVIYQSYKPEQTSTPQSVTQNLPLEAAPTIKNVAPKKAFEDIGVGTDKKAFEDIGVGTAKRIFEDVGVGTEGFVKILEPPKPEYVDLVPAINVIPPEEYEDWSSIYSKKFKLLRPMNKDDFYSKKIKELRSMREPMDNWNLPAKGVSGVGEDDFYSKKIKELRSMREPMDDRNLPAEEPVKPPLPAEETVNPPLPAKPVIPPQYEPLLTSPQIEMGMPYSTPSKPAETDEPSIPPAFKPSFTSPKIDENLLTPERQETTPRVSSVKKMSEEIKRARQVNLREKEIESLISGATTKESLESEQNIPDTPEIKEKKTKGKDTWKYWRDQYRQMTGQEISLKEAKQEGSINDFIDFVKRIK